ncbi:FAD-dependent oxidoreductase [Campylobacter devanensis]|nr:MULTISPECIES: FAD-dependent oxidoreductase [unclassified Campylobacter]
MKNMKDIVILGSGIAGISAGYHLAKKGLKSVIFEKNDD